MRVIRENPTNPKTDGFNKEWHLATTAGEVALTEIEFSLFRSYAAFSRWMDDLTACCQSDDEVSCSGIDFALLNVIRMHGRPKSISDLGRLLNRDDISNIQYGIRKLTKAGLIEKLGAKGHKKGATYRVTDQGRAATDKYALLRRQLLLPLTGEISESEAKMNQISNVLNLLSGIYDQAACVAATHRDKD